MTQRRRLTRAQKVRVFDAAHGLVPLGAREIGRGVILSSARQQQLEDACLALLREGASQNDIMSLLNASRSRVSRWCAAAIKRSGSHNDRRLVNATGQTLAQMLWARVDLRGPQECWQWIGNIKENGYGSLNYKGVAYHAHRAIYELLIAPIPEGAVIDHICRNPRCVNPAHLQCVSQTENLYFASARRAP